MRIPRVVLSTALIVLAAGWLPATAFGQTYTATLTGTVVDPGGAAVPKVKVVAINQATKLIYTAETTDAGGYRIPFLPIGTYVVTAELTGFKKVVSGTIQLEVNQTARVDLTLEIGAVTDEVTVSAVSPGLQTESPTVGTVISGNTTVGLPLNGRNFQQLTLLIPGTITPNPGGFTGPGLQGWGSGATGSVRPWPAARAPVRPNARPSWSWPPSPCSTASAGSPPSTCARPPGSTTRRPTASSGPWASRTCPTTRWPSPSATSMP